MRSSPEAVGAVKSCAPVEPIKSPDSSFLQVLVLSWLIMGLKGQPFELQQLWLPMPSHAVHALASERLRGLSLGWIWYGQICQHRL